MTNLFFQRKPVTVVDSIMGSGKTSWAIRNINESDSKKQFMFVTPYLKEVQRIIQGTNKEFVEPSEDDGKLTNLKKLIKNGQNIACTHELLKYGDSELIQILESKNYTLILDEVMDVISEVKMSSEDIGVILNSTDDSGNPLLEITNKGEVKWLSKDYQDGNYRVIRNLANRGNLMYFETEENEKKKRSMYWLFPTEIFNAFKETYILTYMFSGQVQCYYYQMNNVKFVFKSVRKVNGEYTLVDYIDFKNEDRSHLKELINIYYKRPRDQKDINSIGEKCNALSTNYSKKKIKDKEFKKKLKNDSHDYYRRKAEVPSQNVMWTVQKEFEKVLCPPGLKYRFVAMNARATNDYANVTACIYLVNRYMFPNIIKFFSQREIKVNQELFALSELLQWLFRSAIRNGEPINVFIPSSRMRGLLEDYLNNKI